MKFLAIKIKEVDFWIWFEKTKVEESTLVFTGQRGWGKQGRDISIEVSPHLIEGRMEADELQLS